MRASKKSAIILADEEADQPASFVHYFDGKNAGTDNLSDTITINSLSQTPSVRYRGCDATASTWPAWTYGDSLAIAGSGTAPTLAQTTPFINTYDVGVKFTDGGKYYAAAASTTGDIATECYVLEWIHLPGSTTARVFAGKYDSAAANIGYYCQDMLAGSPSQTYYQSSLDYGASATNTTSDYVFNRSWNHVMLFVYRHASAGNYRYFVNGCYSYMGSNTNTSATMTNSGLFALGNPTNQSAGTLVYFAMWKRASWFTLATTPGTDDNTATTIARTRFYALNGMTAYKALDTSTPTVATRAANTGAFLRRIISGTSYYFMAGGDSNSGAANPNPPTGEDGVTSRWIRVSQMLNTRNETVTGMMIEPAATNLLLQSRTLGTTWSGGTSCTIGSDVDSGPDGSGLADSIIENATTEPHGISQTSPTLTAASYCYSAFLKASGRTWGLLSVATVNASAYFNLSTGAIGTQTNCTAGIEPCANGYYRCWIVYTATAATYSHSVLASTGDGTSSYLGTAALLAIYAYQVQLELGNVPTSPILTRAATITRSADRLYYVGTNNVGGSGAFDGTISFKMIARAVDNATDRTILCLSDTASNADRIEIQALAANDALSVTVASTETGGSVTVTDATPIDMLDGNEHLVKVRVRTNDIALYIDGELRASSAGPITPPNNLVEIHIGEDEAGNANTQLNGLIYDVRVCG